MSGSAHRGVCGREAGPSGPRAWRTAFVIPARATFFLPKPPHAKQEARLPLRLLEAPWFLCSLLVGAF